MYDENPFLRSSGATSSTHAAVTYKTRVPKSLDYDKICVFVGTLGKIFPPNSHENGKNEKLLTRLEIVDTANTADRGAARQL